MLWYEGQIQFEFKKPSGLSIIFSNGIRLKNHSLNLTNILDVRTEVVQKEKKDKGSYKNIDPNAYGHSASEVIVINFLEAGRQFYVFP